MGWLDTPEERRRQHIQMIAKGDIKDLDRIHERDRRRRIRTVFWIIAVISALVGIYFMNIQDYVKMSVAFLLTILIVVSIVFRRRHHHHHRSHGHHRHHHRRHRH